MATTAAPWYIQLFDDSFPAAPLENLLNLISNSLHAALTSGFSAVKASGVQKAASVAERTTAFPSPTQGDRVYRSDLGWEEAYFAAYSASNLAGANTAGWYPVGLGPSVAAQKTALSVTSGPSTNSLTSGAVTSSSPTITLNAATGVFTFQQPGEYLVQITSTQVPVNGAGQRNVSIGTTGSMLAPAASQNYLSMSPIANGAYQGRYFVRINAAGQTITPNFLQNSGVSLDISTAVTIQYVGVPRA